MGKKTQQIRNLEDTLRSRVYHLRRDLKRKDEIISQQKQRLVTIKRLIDATPPEWAKKEAESCLIRESML